MTYQNILKLAKSVLFAGLVLVSAPAFADIFVQPAGVGAPEVAHTLQWDTTENYRGLYNQITPVEATFQSQMAAFIAAPSQLTYAPVLATADALVISANAALASTSARVVVTLPDGTVVIDTSKVNTFVNYETGFGLLPTFVLGQNHNTRVAISTAQAWPNGVGLERKYSTTVLVNQIYVAVRLGALFNNVGTVRLSVNSAAPV